MPYERDLYGCHGTLIAKRRRRNVYFRAHPYHISAPEIAPLLEWCPGPASPDAVVDTSGIYTQIYGGALPWDSA